MARLGPIPQKNFTVRHSASRESVLKSPSRKAAVNVKNRTYIPYVSIYNWQERR